MSLCVILKLSVTKFFFLFKLSMPGTALADWTVQTLDGKSGVGIYSNMV